MRVELVGDIAIVDAEGERHRLIGAQPRACFALLVMERARVVRREELADLLWDGQPSPHWAGAVRGVVAKVRAALAAAGLDSACLQATSGTLHLDLPSGTQIDIDEGTA